MDPLPRRLPLRIELPRPLLAAFDRLSAAGGRCRVVGGSVRDALLGLAPKDIDVEVYGLELERIAQLLAGLGKTGLVGKSFAVVKLWLQGAEYDFAIPRRESKIGAGHRGFAVVADPLLREEDALKRRDFTLNALLYDPLAGEVIDYFGGIEDLQNKRLRHVSPAFREDPLRALRAVQFAGRFDLTLDSTTAQLCQDMRHEFWSLPRERIWVEWEKWARHSRSHAAGLRALLASGWLPFFPELNALVGLPQEPEWHPEGDAWTHTLFCLDALRRETDWAELPEDERGMLAFATLCHDLGKARVTRYSLKRGAKRWISPGHESESVWLSEQLLQRIGAPRLLREKVAALVGKHHYLNTASVDGPSDSSLRRLAKRLHPATARQLIYVLVADHCGRPPFVSEEQQQRIDSFRQRIQELELARQAPDPILKGRHLIQRGHRPGPDFKPILDEAYEAQLDGVFADEDGASRWLDQRLARSE